MTGSGPLRAPSTPTAEVQSAAVATREHLVRGDQDAARAAYEQVVLSVQRRASRLAFCYLRNAADADEAVQDAFVKAYMHLRSYNDAMPFDAWFTRILVNGCLDRLKSRRRRWDWSVSLDAMAPEHRVEPESSDPSPEQALLGHEWGRLLGNAIDRLPDRQRTVVLLTHLDGRTPREISEITGLNENTVRVHLFRAVRRLREWLAPAGVCQARQAED